MNTAEDALSLAGDFDAASRERWLELVAGVLNKGRADVSPAAAAEEFERRLVTHTPEGLDIQPLYTAADVPAAGLSRSVPAERSGGVPWDIRVRVDVAAGTGALKPPNGVLEELATGATSIVLGLRLAAEIDVDALDSALDGVLLDLAPVVLDAGDRVETAAEAMIALWARRGLDPRALTGGFGADPLGDHARRGGAAALEPALDVAARLAQGCVEGHRGVRALVVDSTIYHEAGGSAASELGCSLATGVAYLRTLTAAGLAVDDACSQLEFRLAATADQFTTIAALRAARRCWARIAAVAGAGRDVGGQRQHAVTSAAMTSRYDPWVNLLRTTVAAFAAGVGGAGSVTVTPHDALLVPGGSELGRRMARNVSNILVDESNLARVADPAGGSWYVDRLTADLAEAAWAWFTEIEAAGGMAAALEAGIVGDRLAREWEARAARLARRQDALTGVSEYPNIDEVAPATDAVAPSTRHPASNDGAAAPVPPAPGAPGAGRPAVDRRDGLAARPFHPLTPRRYAEPFEAQRGRADRMTAERGERPAMFLATLGPLAEHSARVGFAQNLFAAGGIRSVTGTPEEFAAGGTALACICSSEEIYRDAAEATAAALKAAGARRVYLAGRPADTERRAALASAGVDEFVHVGCDVVDVLHRALDALEVE